MEDYEQISDVSSTWTAVIAAASALLGSLLTHLFAERRESRTHRHLTAEREATAVREQRLSEFRERQAAYERFIVAAEQWYRASAGQTTEAPSTRELDAAFAPLLLGLDDDEIGPLYEYAQVVMLRAQRIDMTGEHRQRIELMLSEYPDDLSTMRWRAHAAARDDLAARRRDLATSAVLAQSSLSPQLSSASE